MRRECTCEKCGKRIMVEEPDPIPEDVSIPENTTDELLEYELEEAPQSE